MAKKSAGNASAGSSPQGKGPEISPKTDLAALDALTRIDPEISRTLRDMAWPISPKTVLDAIAAKGMSAKQVVKRLKQQDEELTAAHRKQHGLPRTEGKLQLVAKVDPVHAAKRERDQRRVRASMLRLRGVR